MAKIVKFPLKLADGTNARSLEELREHGDVASVLGHYRQGTLARWLKACIEDFVQSRPEVRGIWNMVFYSLIPVVLLLLCTANLVGDSYNPFIYFQF